MEGVGDRSMRRSFSKCGTFEREEESVISIGKEEAINRSMQWKWKGVEGWMACQEMISSFHGLSHR